MNIIIPIVSLILGIVFDYLFNGKLVGVSFPFFILLVLSAFYGLTYYFKRRITQQSQFLAAATLFFAAFMAIRANPTLIFLNIVAVLSLLVLLTKSALGEEIKKYKIVDYVFSVIFLPLVFLRKSIKAIADAFPASLNNSRYSPAVKGALFALPVILVFSLLFYSADLVFKNLIDSIFNFHIDSAIVGHTINIIFVTMLLAGALSLVFIYRDVTRTPSLKLKLSIGVTESSTFLWIINALFIIFTLIQARYLFGGEDSIRNFGFTYAEYARRGFFELLFVVFFAFIIVFLLEKAVLKNENDSHKKSFVLASLSLIVLVILIIIAAFKRLALYIQAYGLTEDRFNSAVFVIWLAAVFLLLAYKVYKAKNDSFFAFSGLISLISFLIAFNVINPHAVIARQNVKHFEKTGKLDTNYLLRLSEDATGVIVEMLDQPESEEIKILGYNLYQRHQDSKQHKDLSWQAWNLGRNKSERLLDQNSVRLERYKDQNPNP
jgi:hypothetical protein